MDFLRKLLIKNYYSFLKLNRLAGFLFFCSFFLFSCRSYPLASDNRNTDFKNTFYKNLNKYSSKYYSCENIDITFDDGEIKKLNLNVSISQGNFIYANANFLGFELGRLQLTPDSLKVINRLDKSFYFGRLENLTSIYGVNFSYKQIETLLLKGVLLDKEFSLKNMKETLILKDSCFVFSSTVNTNLFITSRYNKDSWQLNEIDITDNLNKFFLKAELSGNFSLNEYPKIVQISFTKDKYKADVTAKIGKIVLTKHDVKPFVVNSKYREIEY